MDRTPVSICSSLWYGMFGTIHEAQAIGRLVDAPQPTALDHENSVMAVVETESGEWRVTGLGVRAEHSQLWQAIVMWQIRVRAKADETHESRR